MNKKNLVIKLLLNPRVRRSAIRLLKSPHVRRFIVKQVTRQSAAGKKYRALHRSADGPA